LLATLRSLFKLRKSSDPIAAYAPDLHAVPASYDPESLFREQYARQLRTLAVASGDAEVAADAVQEAFIQLCLRWRRVRRRGDPVLWLRRAAVNSLGSDLGLRTHHLHPIAPTSSTDLSAEPLSEFRGDIEAALAHLSLPERLALALHYMEDLTPADIAYTMDISQEDARTCLHRAREKLQPNLTSGPCPETMIY
jgi:RNA polymerase sigma-70 factor (ECF subfamily)